MKHLMFICFFLLALPPTSSFAASLPTFKTCTYSHFESSRMTKVELLFYTNVSASSVCPPPPRTLDGIEHELSYSHSENNTDFYVGLTETKEACTVYLASKTIFDDNVGLGPL